MVRRCARCFGLSQLGFTMGKVMQPRQARVDPEQFHLAREIHARTTDDASYSRALTRRLTAHMSLVSGPGRGGVADMPHEMRLAVDSHVRYIQSLDTVRTL
jgi:hypothetical protein